MPAPFDMEAAIAAWRRTMQHRRAILGDDVEELERHVRDQIADLHRRGISPEQAFRHAMVQMGTLNETEAAYQDVFWGKMRRRGTQLHQLSTELAMLKNYLKVAARNLTRHPAFTLINLVGLAVGIACCLLIFLFVRDELSYDAFLPHADRIVRVTRGEDADVVTTPANVKFSFEAHLPEVEHVVRVIDMSWWGSVVVRHGDRQFNESHALMADSSFFDVFAYRFLEGDGATALNRPNTAVLTASMAKKYFGDDDPVGQRLTVSNELEYEVTGVVADAPGNTHLPFDIVGSMASLDWTMQPNWTSGNFVTYALLKKDASVAATQAAVTALMQRELGAEAAQPAYRMHLQPLKRIHLEAGANRAYVVLFSTIAVLILLVACINYMNLATARSARRSREVGMRKVLGARRMQLIRQFYGESVILSFAALLVGIGLAYALLPVFNSVSGKHLALDLATLGPLTGAVFVVGAVVSLAAGSYPALVLSSYRPSHVLKGRTRRSHLGTALRKGLVVFQFAVSVLLIVGTLVVLRQLRFVQHVNLGLNREQVVILPLGDGSVVRRYPTLVKELRRDAGVVQAAPASQIPGWVQRSYDNATAEGNPAGRALPTIYTFETDYAVVEALGLHLIAGRTFAPDAVPGDGHYTYILNKAAVRAIGWNPEEAVGKWFNLNGASDRLRGKVVGVVRDFHFRSLRETIAPLALRVYPPQYAHLLVRLHTDDVPAVLAHIEQTWHRVLPDQPFDYTFLDQRIDALYQSDQRLGRIFASFAVLAIVIACLGLFGLASYAAERRTKEIGVRKVMGASVRSIVLLLSKDFARLVLVGFVAAVPIAYYGMHRWLDGFAFRIALSPGVFLLAGTATLALALITVASQTVRAAAKDPVKALRYE